MYCYSVRTTMKRESRRSQLLRSLFIPTMIIRTSNSSCKKKRISGMSHIMKKKYYSYEQICVIALCNMAEYIKIQKHYFVSKTTVSSNELTKSLKVRKVYLLSFCFFCFMTHAYSFLSRFCPS